MEFHQNSFEQPIGFPVRDWENCALPPRTVMSGESCLVEILDPEKHAEELFAAYVKKRNDQDWTYLPYGPFDSFENYLRISFAKKLSCIGIFFFLIKSLTNLIFLSFK